jgi:carbonic anhydrase
MAVTWELLANNERFAESFPYAGLPTEPIKHLAIVTCMDARLDVFSMLGLHPGEAHVIRNAGGVVTDDVIRSLVVSQRFLRTEEIVVIHHTRCGMLSLSEDDLRAAIQQETGMRPPWAFEAFQDLDAEVRHSLTRLRGSPFLPVRSRVRGFVYDTDTGKLREVT